MGWTLNPPQVHKKIKNGRSRMSQIRQKEFSRRVKKRLSKHENERIRKLDSEDLMDLFSLFWEELTSCLSQGHRVIFDGWISIFTNPVKRKCYDAQTEADKAAGAPRTSEWLYAHRVRFRPLPRFRQQAETKITLEEYQRLEKLSETKKK